MSFIPKRQLISTILTPKGREEYLKGKLKFSYFSISDDDIDYSYLAGSDNQKEISASYQAVLEPFFLDTYYESQYIPKIFDLEEKTSSVPIFSSSKNETLSGSNQTINISKNFYLSGISSGEITIENEIEINNILHKLENSEIKQEDYLTHDTIKIDFSIKIDDKDLINLYGATITIKRINDKSDMIIQQNVANPNYYSIGEIKDNKFYEYLILHLSDNANIEKVEIPSLLIPENMTPSTYGIDNIHELHKRLKEKKDKRDKTTIDTIKTETEKAEKKKDETVKDLKEKLNSIFK